MTEPARLFALCARNTRVAVVLRRGPSRFVQMLRWDLKTDKVQAGQWLNARVYERRADLSPDGRHLIFFAATHKGGPASNWTAISRPPYFTALHFYGCNHSWGGGGLFMSDRHYWVDEGGFGLSGAESHLSTGLVRQMQPPDWIRRDRDFYHGRLVRDGWQLLEEETLPAHRGMQTWKWRYGREVRKSWQLIKTLTLSLTDRSPSGSSFWETHHLAGPSWTQELGDEWADVDGRSVILAARGCLFRVPVHAKDPGELKQIADLNGHTFRRVAAPYQGVDRVRA